MKHATLLATALAASFISNTAAFAQDPGTRDGAGTYLKHYGQHPQWYGDGRPREWYGDGQRRLWDRGSYERDPHPFGSHIGPGPRHHYPYSAYRSPYYVAPYFSVPTYSIRIYDPPPVYVERYYIEELPPPPVRRSYSERSYAQVVPPQRPEPPRPPAPPAPTAPRIERITLSAQELFAFDQATLRAPQRKLDEIAEVMNRNPQVDNVRITGHTDRIGSDSYNVKLSQRRADAVKNYLVAKGVAAGRLSAVGKGKSSPVVQCTDKKMGDLIKCLEPNRRVEVEQITVERRVS